MGKDSQKATLTLWGAICGDVIGSCYEGRPTKDTGFQLFSHYSRFTDDTVCSIAVADAILNDLPFDEALQRWCRKYAHAGYGGMFRRWIASPTPLPYNSFGNGSAMRVSACGALGNSEESVLTLAKESAEATHNHPEGIKGAQATALAIWLALQVDEQGERAYTKERIKKEISDRFGYGLDRRYADIQPGYTFDVTCQGSVPEAMIAFLESDDYESTIRNAVALGGDADTQAAIAGGIAAAYYGEIPEEILNEVQNRLPDDMLRVLRVYRHAVETL